MEPRAKIEHNIYTCWRGPPPIKLMGHELWECAVGDGGSMQWQTYTHTHTQCPRDTQGGLSLGQ